MSLPPPCVTLPLELRLKGQFKCAAQPGFAAEVRLALLDVAPPKRSAVLVLEPPWWAGYHFETINAASRFLLQRSSGVCGDKVLLFRFPHDVPPGAMALIERFTKCGCSEIGDFSHELRILLQLHSRGLLVFGPSKEPMPLPPIFNGVKTWPPSGSVVLDRRRAFRWMEEEEERADEQEPEEKVTPHSEHSGDASRLDLDLIVNEVTAPPRFHSLRGRLQRLKALGELSRQAATPREHFDAAWLCDAQHVKWRDRTSVDVSATMALFEQGWRNLGVERHTDLEERCASLSLRRCRTGPALAAWARRHQHNDFTIPLLRERLFKITESRSRAADASGQVDIRTEVSVLRRLALSPSPHILLQGGWEGVCRAI